MKEYSKRDDWKIITNVKVELVKRYIRTELLRIDCTRGIIDIQGSLDFTGQARSALDSISAIQNMLKKLDLAICSVGGVRDVKWDLTGWERKGKYWNYAPTIAIRKIEAKKNLK